MKTLFTFYSTLLLMVVWVGCKEENKAEVFDNQTTIADSLYFDYLLSVDAENPDITLRAQFLNDVELGEGQVLPSTSKLLLDDEIFLLDSTFVNGKYYELQKDINEFVGEHELKFTDINGKEYIEAFTFKPLEFGQSLPETMSRKGVTIQLEGVTGQEKFHIVLTDTVFGSMGVDIHKAAPEGKLILSAEELQPLKKGPIAFELTKELEKPLDMEGSAGGRFVFRYVLRGAFMLVD